MSHTPGPWTVVRRRDGLAVNPPGVALFGEHRDGDANLIAAAPDLLEACKAALQYHLGSFVPPELIAGRLESAIAKAEGKP